MFTQNTKFKTNQCRPTYVWTQIFGWRGQDIKSILLILVLTVTFLGGLIAVPSVQAAQDLVTDHAKVESFAFDGSGTVNPPVISEGSDFLDFSDTVSIFDDLTDGRAAGSEATQNTTIDFDNALFGIVNTSGAAVANWQDDDPGDGRDPVGEATSEFSVTFDLDSVTDFTLSGSIDTVADSSNSSCTSITVTSPSGTTFTVADPPGCGSPGQSIEERGTLQPGRYTFSIVANAVAGTQTQPVATLKPRLTSRWFSVARSLAQPAMTIWLGRMATM